MFNLLGLLPQILDSDDEEEELTLIQRIAARNAGNKEEVSMAEGENQYRDKAVSFMIQD